MSTTNDRKLLQEYSGLSRMLPTDGEALLTDNLWVWRIASRAVGVGVWVYDRILQRTEWSPEALALMGFAPGVYIAPEQVLRRINSDDLPLLDEACRQYLEADMGWDFTVEFRLRPDDKGLVRWIAVHGRVMMLNQPDTQLIREGIAGTIMDVTERKSLEQETNENERRCQRVADAMPHLVWVARTDGVIEYFNDRVSEFRGAERMQDGTWQWSPMIHPEDLAETTRRWERSLQEGRLFEIEHRLQLTDGSYRWFLTRGVPIKDDQGKVQRWYGSATDIQKRKLAEQRLEELTRTLEQQVEERSLELRRRMEQLRSFALALSRTEQRERRQLADMVHNNLQQLIVAALLLLRRLQREVHTDQAVHLLDRGLGLLQRSVDVARKLSVDLSPPVLGHAEFDVTINWLAGWMRDNYDFIVDVSGVEDVRIESEPLRLFLFDTVRELLFNSVKHSGTDRAAVVFKRLANDNLYLRVEDTGRGVEKKMLEDMQSSGKRFGIFSIRERVEAFGGTVVFNSEPGRGFNTEISLPQEVVRRQVEPIPVQIKKRMAAAGNKIAVSESQIRVLVADDHKIVREGLVSVLEEEPDITVVGEAENGRQAVEMTCALLPDVVVMDVNMPQMNGIEATRVIRRDAPETEVVGLSVYDDENIAREMREAGADAYCLKTDTAQSLSSAIHHAVHESPMS